MIETPLRTSFLAELHQRLAAVCGRARTMTAGLTNEQLNWRTEPGKWSIAECLEHTRIAADMYAEKMRPAISAARQKNLSPDNSAPPRHTIAGRLIMWAVDPNIKFTMKAPKDFRPAPDPFPDTIVDQFIQTHESLMKMINDADALPLTKVKFPTPEVTIIHINLADGFALLTMHAERHLNQAHRVREAAGFPG